MKRVIIYGLLGLFLVSLSSFDVHKFYMAIYQINFAPEKKTLQITSRIFLDDLNNALTKKYNKKTFLGTDKESVEDVNSLKKYLAENFAIKVNGQTKAMNFLSKEMDGDVLVCYLNCTAISKITSLEIHNSVLIDWQSEQQNITHVMVLGNKKSILFTDNSAKQVLKY
jgi:hypothetical protein